MEHVEAFLEHIGLGQYAQAFEENAYDSLDMFFVMDETDFKIFGPHVGMKPGHLLRLQKTVFRMKNVEILGPAQHTYSPGRFNGVYFDGEALSPICVMVLQLNVLRKPDFNPAASFGFPRVRSKRYWFVILFFNFGLVFR